MRNSLLLISLFFISLTSLAQKVTIKGTASYYVPGEVGVWINNDYISNTQREITYTDIDSLGNFSLDFLCKNISYITLKIDKNIASMYVQPNMTYEVMVVQPDSAHYQNPNMEHDVNISIKQISKTEINTLTMDYDKRFDDFLSKDYKEFVRRTPQAKIDSFKVAMHSYYSTVTNPYFNNYIDYSIAALEENTKMSEKKLFERYLSKKPVLYDQPEYMNFFNAFFKQKMQNFALSKQGGDIFFQVNDRGSYAGVMGALKRDPFLMNDTICELVLLKGLYETYFDGTFKRESIKAILQQIIKESKIEEHKHMAKNILASFSQLQKGSTAPTFELPDKTGLTHSLDELRAKKYVYLMFYDATCNSCMEQMKVIPSLKKVYGERIEFVSISTDKTNAALKNFQAKNPKYDWTFLYDNTLGKLKTDYEILTLPAYFLIDPDGKIIQIPAETPDGDIEQVFYELTKVKSKLHGVGDKLNHH